MKCRRGDNVEGDRRGRVELRSRGSYCSTFMDVISISSIMDGAVRKLMVKYA